VRLKVADLALPFKVPEVEPLLMLWPRVQDDREPEAEVEATEEPADVD